LGVVCFLAFVQEDSSALPGMRGTVEEQDKPD